MNNHQIPIEMIYGLRDVWKKVYTHINCPPMYHEIFMNSIEVLVRLMLPPSYDYDGEERDRNAFLSSVITYVRAGTTKAANKSH